MQEKKDASSSSCRKQDLRIVCKNFVCSRFFNLKVNIFFVTLNKLNILLEFYFDLHRDFTLYCLGCLTPWVRMDHI